MIIKEQKNAISEGKPPKMDERENKPKVLFSNFATDFPDSEGNIMPENVRKIIKTFKLDQNFEYLMPRLGDPENQLFGLKTRRFDDGDYQCWIQGSFSDQEGALLSGMGKFMRFGKELAIGLFEDGNLISGVCIQREGLSNRYRVLVQAEDQLNGLSFKEKRYFYPAAKKLYYLPEMHLFCGEVADMTPDGYGTLYLYDTRGKKNFKNSKNFDFLRKIKQLKNR